MTALVWEPVDHGHGVVGHRGYLPLPVSGRAKIASIYWNGRGRNDPKPWKLKTELPGYQSERGFETPEEAQATADRILARFVETATAALEASKA